MAMQAKPHLRRHNRRPEVAALLARYEADLARKAQERIDEGTTLIEDVKSAQSLTISRLQALIDTGTWSLEGAVGRHMMAAIDHGHCVLGDMPARDFWGNQVPAWWMLEPGTKGTPEFVAKVQNSEDAW